MAFGKKKNQISNKVTQTHRISVDGVLDVRPDGQIFVEVEEVGVVPLSRVLQDMDGRDVSLAISTKREDCLEIDLHSEDEEEDDEVNELVCD